MMDLGANVLTDVLANQIGWAFTGLACVVPLILFIIWIALAIWVYKDAEKRGKSGALWLIIVIITGIIGLIVWLVVRPDMSEVKRQQQMGQQQMGQQQWQQQQPQQPQQQQPQQQQPQQQQQNACPDCGGQMRYINENNQWYCDRCQEYK